MGYLENLEKRPWWFYLDKIQQDLLLQSLHLIEEESKRPKNYKDYSFVVFPAAKAYEGFLKKIFFDLGLITKEQFLGDKFRIGRALNPTIFKEYPHESVYERLTRFCGGKAVAERLWNTWKNSRNLVFHYFFEKENLISFSQAKERVEEIILAIDFSFKECRPKEGKIFFKKRMLKNSLLVFILVFSLWTFYRLCFNLTAGLEEIIIKPLFWLLPVFISIKYFEKRFVLYSLGYGGKTFQKSFLLVFGFLMLVFLEGIILGLVRYQKIFLEKIFLLPISSLENLFLILITAVVEETFFRGYLFNRLWESFENLWKANILTGICFILIHLPLGIFVLHYSFTQIFFNVLMLLVMSLGSGWLFSLTYNIVPSILWHFFWNWQVILGV